MAGVYIPPVLRGRTDQSQSPSWSGHSNLQQRRTPPSQGPPMRPPKDKHIEITRVINFIETLPHRFPELRVVKRIRNNILHDDATLTYGNLENAISEVLKRELEISVPKVDLHTVSREMMRKIASLMANNVSSGENERYLCEMYLVFFYFFRDVQQHLYIMFQEEQRDKPELIEIFNKWLGHDWRERFPTNSDFPEKVIDQKWLRWRRLYLQFNEEIMLDESGEELGSSARSVLERLKQFFEGEQAAEPGGVRDPVRFKLLNQNLGRVDIFGFLKRRQDSNQDDLQNTWLAQAEHIKEIGDVENTILRYNNFAQTKLDHTSLVRAIEDYTGTEMLVDGMTCIAHITNPIKDRIKFRPGDLLRASENNSFRLTKLEKMQQTIRIWPEMVLTPLILAAENEGSIIFGEDGKKYKLLEHPSFGDVIFSALDVVVDDIGSEDIKEKYEGLKKILQ